MRSNFTPNSGESVNTTEDDYGPGMLLSPAFWLGGLLSLAAWTALWVLIAEALERIN
jgi:hypothetical protein